MKKEKGEGVNVVVGQDACEIPAAGHSAGNEELAESSRDTCPIIHLYAEITGL